MQQGLKFNHIQTKGSFEVKKLERAIDLLAAKITYFELPEEALQELAEHCQSIRSICGLKHYETKFETENLQQILKELESFELDQSVEFNRRKNADSWTYNYWGEFSIDKINQLIRILAGSGENIFGGDSSSEYLISEQDSYFLALKNWVRQSDEHPLTKAWTIYLLTGFSDLKGIDCFNLAGLLLQNQLMNDGFDLGRILHPETDLRSNEAWADRLYTGIKHTDNIINIGEALDHCFEASLKHTQRLDRIFKNIYKNKINYSALNPRQRNYANYRWENGFEKFARNSRDLNERQNFIIKYLLQNRFAFTKDLYLSFKCNRKTIQRDFSELLEKKIVRIVGNGAALRYTLNLRDSEIEDPKLAYYHYRIKEIDNPQTSLFDEPWYYEDKVKSKSEF